jgi:hypothetical protein
MFMDFAPVSVMAHKVLRGFTLFNIISNQLAALLLAYETPPVSYTPVQLDFGAVPIQAAGRNSQKTIRSANKFEGVQQLYSSCLERTDVSKRN